jgi:hypothetical protein
MLIFIATPLKFIASALTLVWIGACVGYIVRDVQAQDAKP